MHCLGIYVVGGLFPQEIMSLMTKDADTAAEGVSYLMWALPCFILYGLSMTTTIVLRNSGKVRIPLYSSVAAFFINVFFNWIFIFGNLGAPEMGIAGAALGTLISRVFEFCVICGYFLLKDKSVGFKLRDMFMNCKSLIREYFRFSVPVMISDTLIGFGNSAVTAVAGHIGNTFMAANSITMVVQQMGSIFSSGVGQSALIVTGNTLGEGDGEKAKVQAKTLTALSFALGALCCVVIYAVGLLIIGCYNIQPETEEVALSLVHATGIIMIFMMPGSVLTKGILRGGGDTMYLMIIDVVFLWLVSVPLGAAARMLWNFSPFFILICLRIDNIIKTCICLVRLAGSKWIKKIRKD